MLRGRKPAFVCLLAVYLALLVRVGTGGGPPAVRAEGDVPDKFLFSIGGHADAGRFNYPFGVAVAPDGTVYVADCGNGRIQASGGPTPAPGAASTTTTRTC